MTDSRAIRPLAEDRDTVLLRRTDYEALLRAAEDAADAAQIREAEARVAAGEDEYVPIELTRRLMAGEVPLRVWREHRGLSGRALAHRAGISAAYLSQIETGRKPGSFDAMAKLARALDIDMEDLAPWPAEAHSRAGMA
jgi:DNA-binding Xre family transcriptional regulator